MSFKFTVGQEQAMQLRGSALLVSAAAGSGKTRVLTERLLRYVTDPSAPADVDRFLVITYTRPAAAELRSRIMDALAEQAAAHPSDLRLRRQQSLCCRAPIGTIHSFCSQILREYSQLLGISPAFAVLDEDRAGQLRNSVASRLLDRHYESIDTDSAFRLLVDTTGAGRDDQRLQESLLQLYQKLQSHPYPAAWAEAQKTALNAEGVTDAADTVWGQELLSDAKAAADYWISAMEDAIAEIEAADDGGKIVKSYGTRFVPAAEQLRDFRRAMDVSWDRAREFSGVEFARLGGLRNYPDPALQARVKAVWDGCKSTCKALGETFSQDTAALLRDLRSTAPAMGALLDLTMEFDRAYTAEKNRRSALDFSDLEHYAARLLVDEATGAPTWVARELSQRYTEIMVDEYQDVNAVQEMIFRAVSRDGTNLFLVGDVKQSIYRFRLADPGLFLEKYRSYAPADTAAPGEPRRILLQENFRSRRPVLDATNHVMGCIMSRTLGELDYDDDAALKYGAVGYDPALDVPAELHVIDTDDAGSDEEDGESPAAAELEARFVAGKILEMVRARTPVTENGVTRPCNWGDFVLLMLSPKSKGKVFHRVLEEAGIPVDSRQSGGFFSSLEVAVTIDLLAVIDNPHADVPLISALRSPAFGFSADELSAIRAADRSSDFYGALLAAADAGSDRCAGFLQKLEGWRALAPELSPDALVWRVCSDTGMFAVCTAMGDGGQRRQNLMHLFELARTFGESGNQGLFRFVQWLRRMAENNTEPDVSPAGKAVRIMTIHKSKGLEFPFVFLCDLSHRFNMDDFKKRVLMHAELGLGPKVVDTRRGLEYPTIARRAVQQRLTTELLSEEMRVLYVAMTRAKEQLIMSCTWSKAREKLDELTPLLRTPLPPEILRGASGFSKWIALSALQAPELIPIVIHSAGELTAAPAEVAQEAGDDGETAAALEQLRARLDFVYPWAGSVDLPSKLTATELKTPLDPADPEVFSARPDAEPDLSFRRPVPGAMPRALSAAQRGTATHLFLQYVDFARAGDAEGLRAELQRMEAARLLTPEEAAAIDLAAVERFFTAPLGQRLRAAETVRREFRFLLLADAADYFPAAAGGEDQLLLQGVADCCFEENGGITLLDYKTDRVTAEQVPARAEHYRGQLRSYAAALERIFGLPVRHCVLWFLHVGTEYEVEL